MTLLLPDSMVVAFRHQLYTCSSNFLPEREKETAPAFRTSKGWGCLCCSLTRPTQKAFPSSLRLVLYDKCQLCSACRPGSLNTVNSVVGIKPFYFGSMSLPCECYGKFSQRNIGTRPCVFFVFFLLVFMKHCHDIVCISVNSDDGERKQFARRVI